MKKNLSKNNSRLYVTEDTDHDNVWFARTEAEQFARIKHTDMWEVWFYKDKFTVRLATLKQCLELIDKQFKEYWYANN